MAIPIDQKEATTVKVNCWEFKKCGRQPGGHKEKELGTCPVTIHGDLDGAHEGKNGGRACWVISGTLCKGETQGTFANKYKNCEICDFYQRVRKEEGPNFVYSIVLLGKLRKK